MKFKIIVLIALSILWLQLFAVNDNAGTSGFAFFKLACSARVSALGGAFTGLADDLNAVFYNPAGLVRLPSKQVQATYMNYFDGVHCGSAVFAYPRNEKETYALFTQFLTASEDRTYADEFGELVETGETFGMSDILIGISASRYIISVIDLGINIKFLQETLDDKSASAVALDIALLHQTTNEFVKVGIAVKNVGYQLSHFTSSEYDEKLPMFLSAGISYNPDRKFLAVLDINKPLEHDFYGTFGIEYQLYDLLDLRAGYKSNASNWRTGGEYEIFSGISLGLGINWNRMGFDYSLSSYGDLGLVNQLSLKYNF